MSFLVYNASSVVVIHKPEDHYKLERVIFEWLDGLAYGTFDVTSGDHNFDNDEIEDFYLHDTWAIVVTFLKQSDADAFREWLAGRVES